MDRPNNPSQIGRELVRALAIFGVIALSIGMLHAVLHSATPAFVRLYAPAPVVSQAEIDEARPALVLLKKPSRLVPDMQSTDPSTPAASVGIFMDGQPRLFYVLVHTTHGNEGRERAMYNSGLPRMLNVTGRWSSHPTELVPVLVWATREEAEDAATVARRSKGRASVRASGLSSNRLVVGRQLRLYTPDDAPALVGYRDYGPAAQRKQEAARIKVLAYASRLVGDATHNAQLVERARELSPRSGVGAIEHLAGKAGSEIARRIVDGSLPSDELVTSEVVAQAVLIAHAAMADRDAREASLAFRPA